MPKVSDLRDSRFLTKNDVEPDMLVTIEKYAEENVAMESQAPELKWVLYFKEFDKPLVLNTTNGQVIEILTGTDDFDGWIGKQVVLYNDKTVSFAGKITGGIRVKEAVTNVAAGPQAQPVDDEEVPF